MQTFNNLPGTIINTIDGGLTSAFTPADDAVLVIGTSGEGLVNTPYQVTDLGVASNEFGLSGSLYRGVAEASLYSDNVIAFRMGTTPLVLSGVGLDTTSEASTPGFNISFGDVTNEASTTYQIWYKAGVLAVWENGEIQFSNQSGAAVDTGNVTITNAAGASQAAAVTGNVGLQIGSGSTPVLSAALTVAAAAALSSSSPHPAPTISQPAVDGTALTQQQIYVAMRQAFDLLQGIQVKIVFVPDAIFDNPNVAFYVSADSTTAANNPTTNPNALDWLLVTQDIYNDNIYQWASSTTNSAGLTVTAMTAVTAATRVAAGFNEVNFGHSVASFCAEISQIGPKCVGVIGTSLPNSAGLTDTRRWVGFLPVYNTKNQPTSYGGGLLGIPYLTGTTSTKLNPLTSDYSTGFRLPGLYVTSNDAYDGTVEFDLNGNPIDAGGFLHVFADFGIISSAFGQNYLNRGAGVVAGYLSALDAASGLTNKAIKIGQVWNGLPSQLDALTEAKVSVLRSAGSNQNPTLLHDLTAANNASDYTNLVRVRCMGVVIQTLLNRANKYIGESSLDGLTLISMQTQLVQDLVALQQRGYCTRPNVRITSTPAQQKIGHATLYLTCHPADELIQLTAYVAVGQ